MKQRNYIIGFIAVAVMAAVVISVSDRVQARLTPGIDVSVSRADQKAATVEPFVFCVIADPHCSEGTAKGDEKLGDAAARFMRCFETIKSLPESDQPDFALVLGDLHVDAFAKLLPDIPIPLYVTMGNHEDKNARKKIHRLFPDDFHANGVESDYYSFVHKGVRFIGVCDAIVSDHVGHLCSEAIQPRGQCEWLEKELTQPEADKILFAHIPTEPDGKDDPMCLSRNDSRYLNELVRRTKPTAMFFGHLHKTTSHYTLGQTSVFQTRSCCWNFNDSRLGFLLVRVDPKGIHVKEIFTNP